MFSDAVVAAIVTTVGSIAAALITAATAVTVERIKNQTLDPKSKWKWVRRLGYPLGIVTVLLAVGSVFYLFYDATTWRLTNALANVSPGYKKQIYANIGLAFIYPTAWQIEDYAFRFSGGDMELISDRDGITETQGIKLGLENIAEHHWADPESQFQHVRERLKKCQPFGQQKTSIANGRLADLFTCSVPIADGKKVDAREYYYQLSKCINLKIVTWSELTGNQRSRFDSQRDEFLSNMRLDDAKLHESGEFCIAHY